MNFLQKLESHTGGLLRIKSDLFWFGRGWDGTPGRLCLLLDASPLAARSRARARTPARLGVRGRRPLAAALLLIDGAPHWVWVANEDVELIT